MRLTYPNESTLLRDNQEWGECRHHGLTVFRRERRNKKGWSQRHCLACERERDRAKCKREPGQITQEQRRRIEEHQHKTEDDWWED